jgi:hypothetical protein
MSNQGKAARRIKRGGDTEVLSLDFDGAEGQIRAQQVPDGLDLEAYFSASWPAVRSRLIRKACWSGPGASSRRIGRWPYWSWLIS